MSIFNEFPYTNFHEMNLDWIIARVKEWLAIAENWEKWKDDIEAAFEDLKDYIDSYFDNLDVQEEINNKLDEMLANGSLERLVVEALNLRMAPERKEEFQEMVIKTALSYLLNNRGATYFEAGTPLTTGGFNMVTKYSNSNSWQSYRWNGTPVYSDTEEVDGLTCNVMYCDCTSFAALVYSGIKYEDSPYIYGFQGGEINTPAMIAKGMPRINAAMDNDFVIDFNSLNNTDWISWVLTQSGFNYFMISRHDLNSEIVNYYDNISTLETGDILLAGGGEPGQNIYKHTGHCMIYIKTLAELNEIAAQYGVTLRPTDNEDQDLGLILECTFSSAENDYTNCLNISTLRHYINREITKPENIIYAFKIASRATNSNAARHYESGIWRDYNTLYFVPTENYDPASVSTKVDMLRSRIFANGIALNGEDVSAAASGLDADKFPAGTWRCTSSAVLRQITNIPINTNFFILDCVGRKIGNAFYGIQTFRVISGTYPLIWVRSSGSTGWGSWRQISWNNCGVGTFGQVAANSSQTVTITFDYQYDSLPVISVTKRGSGAESIDYADVDLVVQNVTRNGFEVRCINKSATAFEVPFYWTANNRNILT